MGNEELGQFISELRKYLVEFEELDECDERSLDKMRITLKNLLQDDHLCAPGSLTV